MTTHDLRLKILVITHVVLVLIAAILAPVELDSAVATQHLPNVPHLALTFCQVILLGAWAAFSRADESSRLVVLVTGLVVLEVLFEHAVRGELLPMPTAILALVLGALLVLRRFGVRVDRVTVPVDLASAYAPEMDLASAQSWEPRPSIRGLVVLLVAGLVVLGTLFEHAMKGKLPPMLTASVIVGLAVGALLGLAVGALLVLQIVGGRGGRVVVPVGSAPAQSRTSRFSVRGLMVLTAVVTLGGAQLRSMAEGIEPRSVGITIFWCYLVVVVGLMSIRVGLGFADPLWRALPIIVLSPVLGLCFRSVVRVGEEGWVYLYLIMLLYPVLLIGSLLVVRSCGFRLLISSRASPK